MKRRALDTRVIRKSVNSNVAFTALKIEVILIVNKRAISPHLEILTASVGIENKVKTRFRDSLIDGKVRRHYQITREQGRNQNGSKARSQYTSA
jgi:hypothetical protein